MALFDKHFLLFTSSISLLVILSSSFLFSFWDCFQIFCFWTPCWFDFVIWPRGTWTRPNLMASLSVHYIGSPSRFVIFNFWKALYNATMPSWWDWANPAYCRRPIAAPAFDGSWFSQIIFQPLWHNRLEGTFGWDVIVNVVCMLLQMHQVYQTLFDPVQSAAAIFLLPGSWSMSLFFPSRIG